MTAAAPRMANQTTVDRRLGVAVAALIAVLALSVAVAIGQPVATSTTTSATSAHDYAVGPVRYGNAAGGAASAGGINVTGVPHFVTNDLSVGTPKQVPHR